MPFVTFRAVHVADTQARYYVPEATKKAQEVQSLQAKLHGVTPKTLRWAYGVTTVPSRREGLLPRTLASLAAGGFPSPRLFIDGVRDTGPWAHLGQEMSPRYPAVRTYANWVLGLWELWLRDPHADRYALFQDDIVCVRNLRPYLEAAPYPDKRAYLNLYTFPYNQPLSDKPREPQLGGWFLSNQRGLGALGLVFLPAAVEELLSHPDIRNKCKCPIKGWRNLDGAVINALSHKGGWQEYCHASSLLRHTGDTASSLIDHVPRDIEHRRRTHPNTTSFPGEDFDALTWVGARWGSHQGRG